MATKKTEQPQKRLVLLDSHAILHRAYHALPDFSSSTGEPTGALYGLSTMLIKIIQELKPDYIAACFDVAAPTYRHEAYDQYKAHRSGSDDELKAQIQRSRDVFQALGIPIYEKEGFEADDVIGTIVEQMRSREDVQVVIASGDMDTLQLVDDEKVQVFTLKRGIEDTVMYDEDAVIERFGFSPPYLADYKGLCGDPSDNIVGVKGIGEKTASALIQQFGSIEDIYTILDEKGEDVFRDAGIKTRALNLLKEGEEEAQFSKMLATIRRDVPIEYDIPERRWIETLDMSKIVSVFRELGFRSLTSRIQNLSSAVYEEGDDETAPHELRDLSDEEVEELKVATWVLNSDLTNPSVDDILHFTGAATLSQARETVLERLAEEGLLSVYNDIEKPLIPIVRKMHERGIRVDASVLADLSEEYHKELDQLKEKIWKEAGEEFNINSPKQLGEVLFEKLQLSTKGIRKTGGGKISTAESELEKLRGQHEVIDLILEYRAFQKLLSTYIDNIPQMLSEDGRLHAEFLQHGTTTGRMSSQSPNLQNIPVKNHGGREIRRAFRATDGFHLVAFDYSQIELRVAAILSGDEKLVGVFASGRDVHTEVASQVFEVPREQVDKEMRRKAKVINFGILYGMGVNALKKNLGSSQKEARTFYDEYFEKFPQLAEYIERVKADAARRGYTETYFGRRRYFQGLNSSVQYIRAGAERMAINAPVQGTSADIIKIAMRDVDRHLTENDLQDDVYLLAQVHDELMYEMRDGVTEKAIPEVRRIMERTLPADDVGVPLVVEAEMGKNWGELHRLLNS